MAHGSQLTVRSILGCIVLCAVPAVMDRPVRAETHRPEVDPIVLDEAQRIAMIGRVAPSVVSILDATKRGGGSGVVIDPQGYGLTNYHVIAGSLIGRRGWGGLSDGKVYEMEILGVDPTGDVAMFRLKGGKPFAYAKLGDSDRVRLGDDAIAMGNPFILSEDHTPAVTLGIVTGTHRYQEGSAGNLIYTDCIQTDASINPGNSGGPLFNAAGEVVGINGRISINTRGRYNVGFGYAISINQIHRFIPALRAGLLARHGALLATVKGKDGAVVFDRISPDSPVIAAGVRIGDRLVAFDGAMIESPNHFASVQGTYPEDWPITLTVERDGERWTRILRLAPVEPMLQRPFEVDSSVNEREVRRVLGAFQNATLVGGDAANRPNGWRWSVTREGVVDLHTGEVGSACFIASQEGNGPVRMRRRDENNSSKAVVEYDASSATWRATPDGERFDLPGDARMVCAALYVLQRQMLKPIEEMDLSSVAHMGADAYVRLTGEADPSARTTRDTGRTTQGASRVLEVIAWSIAEDVVARFAFDPATGLCVRARVRDSSLQAEITIELTDHRDIGEMVRPCTMEVSGPGFKYRDELSEWERIP